MLQVNKKNLFFLSLTLFILVFFVGLKLLPTNDKWRIAATVPDPVRKIGKQTLRELQDLPYAKLQYTTHELPVYELEIKDFEFLQNNIPDDNSYKLEKEHKDPVPFKLEFDGEKFEGKISLHGGGKVHWLWPKKSYNINFKKSEHLHGRDQLDLIVPHDRQFIVEQFNNYRARKLGLIVPETKFVTIRINGGEPMVYWQSERLGREFLETQGLSSAANLYEADATPTGSIFDSVDRWDKELFDPRFEEIDTSDLQALLDLLNNADNDVFSQYIFSLMDEENFYAWNTHAILAKSNHQDWAHNLRLYFDPSLGKFIVLPWDVGVGYNYPDENNLNLVEESWNLLTNRILANPEFLEKRNQRLVSYLQDENNIKADLEYYDNLWDSVKPAFYQDKIRRFNFGYVKNEIMRYRDILEQRFYFLRDLLNKEGVILQQVDVPIPGESIDAGQEHFKGYKV
jgi:spore coat protein H